MSEKRYQVGSCTDVRDDVVLGNALVSTKASKWRWEVDPYLFRECQREGTVGVLFALHVVRPLLSVFHSCMRYCTVKKSKKSLYL